LGDTPIPCDRSGGASLSVTSPAAIRGKGPTQMPLFGPPNVLQLAAKRDAQSLIKALAYKDASIRIAAANALAPLKDPLAVEPLTALLKDESNGVRRAAVASLAARGGSRVVGPLVGALQDPSPEVRAEAAKAVYKHLMTDPDQETRRATAAALGLVRTADAVEPLVKAIMDSDEGVRLAAIKALQAIGDVRAVVPLIVALAHEQTRHKTTGRSSLAVERAASQALDALCDTSAAIGPLRTALAHDEDDAREIAVKHLARIADPAVANSLLTALTDRDATVRRTAARGLAETGWLPQRDEMGARYWAALREWRRCPECGPAAIPLLVASFETVDVLERTDILEALASLNWEPDSDSATATHYWASRGDWDKCIEIGAPAVEALESVVRSNPRWRQRVAAAGALAAMNETRPTPFARIDLIQQALAVIDGDAEGTLKRESLETMLAEQGQFDPEAGERIEWCRCGYPASRVRTDALREPLTDMLGFEQSSSNATTYYCPSCDTRRTTVAG
jgi:HEAT repeat protein